MRNILVTGSTDGIGRETARQLARSGTRVLVHGRNETKAQEHAQALSREARGSEIAAVWGDLARMDEVVALAEQTQRIAPQLDVLINNAGVYQKRRTLTADGFETTMAVNHFAPFLLTHRLLPALRAAPAARVVNVSSMAHQSGALDPDDLTFENGFSGYDAYASSKLANILFTTILALQLADSAITANALHPGVIDTKLLHAGFNMKGASLSSGARTSVYLATSDEVARTSGKYFVDCKEAAPSRAARDKQLAQTLWDQSERLLAQFF